MREAEITVRLRINWSLPRGIIRAEMATKRLREEMAIRGTTDTRIEIDIEEMMATGRGTI